MAGKKKNRKNTRELVLDAAEKVFSTQGFAGASVREITAKAGVNLPAVYYYFGSKQGLMQAVLERRISPIRLETRELLRRFEAEAGDRPVAVEKILEAMLLPPLRLAASGSAAHALVMQLIGRIMSEPDPQTQALLLQRHEETRAIFFAAFARSLPDLPGPVLMWRCEFAWGTLGAILSGSRRIGKTTKGVCNPLDSTNTLAQMIAFLAAGFRAAEQGPVVRSQ
jgi:AcrR family transcriptional regulator